MEENQQVQVRQEKVAKLREMGINPYPNKFKPQNNSVELAARFADDDKEALQSVEEAFSIAGRVMFIREFGKLAFFKVQDAKGQIQASISLGGVGEEVYAFFKEFVDVGDIVGVVGKITRTNKGELTLGATELTILNKTVNPLPEKWHGLTDKELRYRQRYVDLIVNDEVRDTFRKRSQIVSAMRRYLEDDGFMEVETPILHKQAGGAAAKPFETHHNALDLPLKLRIAPELDLKRLVVGGMGKVFEIGRTFRNEGISYKHNPEFTMLEAYSAYSNCDEVMDLVEDVINHTVKKVCGNESVTYKEQELSFAKPFKRMTMEEALIEIGGATTDNLKDEASLDAFAKSKGLEFSSVENNYGYKFAFVFEELCEDKLIQPTFICRHPEATSPLARVCDDDPDWTERYELYICGSEISNGYSELNDPEIQKRHFEAQVERQASDGEAMPYDADYINALNYGLPPTGGWGVGVDRLVMILTDQHSIRDVLLFPLMRPHNVEEVK